MILIAALALLLCAGDQLQADVFGPAPRAKGARNDALVNDAAGNAVRGLDLDIASESPDHVFSDTDWKDPIAKQYRFEDTVMDEIKRGMFYNDHEVNDFVRRIQGSALLLLQYSQPAAADLFKFHTSLSYWRTQMMLAQMQSLENEQGGLMAALFRQGLYDCVQASAQGLSASIERCLQGPMFGNILRDEKAAQQVDVMVEVFNILNRNAGRDAASARIIRDFQAIAPRWVLTAQGFQMRSAPMRAGTLLSEYRTKALEYLERAMQAQQAQGAADPQDLAWLAVPGVPLHPQRFQDLLLWEPSLRQMKLSQWATSLARVKVAMRYRHAREWCRRALMNPRVKEGYKLVVRSIEAYLLHESSELESQIDEVQRHREWMEGMINDADQLSAIMAQRMRQQKATQKELLYAL